MMSPAPAPPSSENLTLIVVVILVVGVVVVLAAVFAAVLYGRQLSAPTGPGPGPRVIGIAEARSSDGTNWILTFTTVPTALSPYNTMLAILTASGATALSASPLAYLNGTAGVSYVPVQPGGSVQVGDRLLISTATYPTGYSYRIFDATTTFAIGTLQ